MIEKKKLSLGWRFVTNPGCLWAQVIKGLCFYNGFSMQMQDREPLGDGKAYLSDEKFCKDLAKIQEEPCLPSLVLQNMVPRNSKFHTSLGSRFETGQNWNEVLLNDLFSIGEIAAIKNVQIRDAPCQDRWVWRFIGRGTFSVKYTYHAQVNDSVSINASPSSSNSVSISTRERIMEYLFYAQGSKLPVESLA